MKKSEFMNLVLGYSIENEKFYTVNHLQLYVCNSIQEVEGKLPKISKEVESEISKLADEITKDIAFWLNGRSTVAGWLRNNPNTPRSFHDIDALLPLQKRTSELNHYRILWIQNIIEYYQSIGD